MSGSGKGPDERKAVVFFGRLAASVTHELNNVLSTIDQNAGLLGDTAARMASGGTIDPGKLTAVRERIDRQVRRGVEIVSRFNRFAHSVDDPEAEFDAGEVLDNLMLLAGRFADLARVRLVRGDWKDLRGAGDAFMLQEAVFAGLREFLGVSGEGDRIEIGLDRDGADGVVTIAGTARAEPVAIRFRSAGSGGATERR